MGNLIDTIITVLRENQILAGGSVMVLLGGLMAYARNVPKLIWSWARRQFTVRVEIRDHATFEWFAEWLAEQSFAKKTRRLSARQEYADDGTIKTTLSPGRGIHVFRYGSRWFWLDRQKSDSKNKDDSMEAALMRETFLLHTYGRNPEPIRKIMAISAERAYERGMEDVVTYMPVWSSWEKVGQVAHRSLDSIILPGDLKERIADDVEMFLARRDWYVERGIPYRRGYLLHGEPGTGKSSLVKALAHHCKVPIYCFTSAFAKKDASSFMDLMSNTKCPAIILFEDVDCLFAKRSDDDKEGASIGLSFSDFLNAIDGLNAQEGRMVFMTTNHPEKLDDALMREGRIDVKYHISAFGSEGAGCMFQRFYPEAPKSMVDEFRAAIGAGQFIGATLQGYFLRHESPDEAVRNAGELIATRNGHTTKEAVHA